MFNEATARPPSMHELLLSDTEFGAFRALMRDAAGVDIPASKKQMVSSRLQRRLRARGVGSFAAYHRLVTRPGEADEFEQVIDLLTTHETYFFREARHFEVLATQVLPALTQLGRELRVWSAATASGEEAWSLAMVLMDQVGPAKAWGVLGSDISRAVLARAVSGVYPMLRTDGIPTAYRERYCRQVVGETGMSLHIEPTLRERIRFARINLNERLHSVGLFDIVFLRNALIYFDPPTRRAILARLAAQMQPQGWLFIGHSETLNGLDLPFVQVMPTVYRKRPTGACGD